MPPKKKIKPIAGQQTIAAVFSAPTTSALLPGSDQPRESTSTLPVPTSASSSTEPDEPTAKEVPQPSASSCQKKQTFLKQWLTTYKWLRFSDDNFMYCDICTTYNKTGTSMHKSNKCSNYQHSTITRHVLSKEHQASVFLLYKKTWN